MRVNRTGVWEDRGPSQVSMPPMPRTLDAEQVGIEPDIRLSCGVAERWKESLMVVTTGFADAATARTQARKALREQGHQVGNGARFRQSVEPFRTGPREQATSWFLACEGCGAVTQVRQVGREYEFTLAGACTRDH